MSKQDKLFDRQSIRSALTVWDDLKELGQHPLAQLRIVQSQREVSGYSDTLPGHGLAMRKVLGDAIESLKPVEQKLTNLKPRERAYFILTQEYIEGRNLGYIADCFPISKDTLRRDRRTALDRLGNKLHELEQRHKQKPPPPPPPAPRPPMP